VQSKHWDQTTSRRDKVVAEIAAFEARGRRIEEIRNAPGLREYPGVPTTVYLQDQNAELLTGRTLNEHQAGALRALEGCKDWAPDVQDRQDKLIREDSFHAREFRAHSDPNYCSAFKKLVSLGEFGASLALNDAERAALSESYNARSIRAQSEGTTTSGGVAIPVYIDPTVIISDQGTNNPFLQVGRVVDVQTNAWKGVSSAGAVWSFDPEGSTVSDDGLYSLVQPTVTVFSARGFIPYSIEIEQDWPDFQSEMARILTSGYDELLVEKFCSGSGTGEPRGILTAMTASSPTSIVTSTTDGAFGMEDVYKTWSSLPQRWRRNASWFMSVSAMNRIREMGTLNNWHAVTVQLPAGAIDRLFERSVYEAAYFDDVTVLTTGAQTRMVLGDWSNYVIARRSPMTAELVPHLLDVTSGRPTGSRGFFSMARVGSNSVNDAAFRSQQNT